MTKLHSCEGWDNSKYCDHRDRSPKGRIAESYYLSYQDFGVYYPEEIVYFCPFCGKKLECE